MELIIAVGLFIGIVGSWLVLPSSPAEKAGHATPVPAPGKA